MELRPIWSEFKSEKHHVKMRTLILLIGAGLLSGCRAGSGIHPSDLTCEYIESFRGGCEPAQTGLDQYSG